MATTIIIFTRLPQPGSTKTRLIPRLGPAGAAALHRALAEHTVATVRQLPQPMVICHTGDSDAIRQWLGAGLSYRQQATGDLGARMLAAITASQGPAVIIGTDCPDLSGEIIGAAVTALKTSDVVLGPALDGGYYLIGMTRPHAALFDNMTWGGDEVLAETRRRLQAAHLSWTELTPLTDIDRPADLVHVPQNLLPQQYRR